MRTSDANLWLCLSCILTGLFSFSCSDDEKADMGSILINEIYPAAGTDWIELYNSTEREVDAGDYVIYDESGARYVIPSGTLMPSKGFLILICDGSGTGLQTNFELSADGETISLEDPSGSVIDRITYPILGDGQSYGRYPDGGDKWGRSGVTTRGASNGYNQGAVINSVSRVPLVPTRDDAVTVKAEVISNSGVSNVILFYGVNDGQFVQKEMLMESGMYNAVIPATNSNGTVRYYVAVTNSFSMTSFSPYDAPDRTYEYILNDDPLPLLRINELMASNTSCCPDTDGGTSEFDDWIEIYNAGLVSVDIGGMYLSDDNNNPFGHRISDSDPALTTIPPGGFLLLWADEDEEQGPLHLGFRLSSAGEDIGLFYIDGRAIDTRSFGPQTENQSGGLIPDGGSLWQVLSGPTPGASNN